MASMVVYGSILFEAAAETLKTIAGDSKHQAPSPTAVTRPAADHHPSLHAAVTNTDRDFPMRRLVKDYENLTRNHAAFIILAMIRLLPGSFVRMIKRWENSAQGASLARLEMRVPATIRSPG
jgi:hypothetical protein